MKTSAFQKRLRELASGTPSRMRISIRPWRYEHFSPAIEAEAKGRFVEVIDAPQHLGSAPHRACDAHSHNQHGTTLSGALIARPPGRRARQ